MFSLKRGIETGILTALLRRKSYLFISFIACFKSIWSLVFSSSKSIIVVVLVSYGWSCQDLSQVLTATQFKVRKDIRGFVRCSSMKPFHVKCQDIEMMQIETVILAAFFKMRASILDFLFRLPRSYEQIDFFFSFLSRSLY